jgi:hypothetical protein
MHHAIRGSRERGLRIHGRFPVIVIHGMLCRALRKIQAEIH